MFADYTLRTAAQIHCLLSSWAGWKWSRVAKNKTLLIKTQNLSRAQERGEEMWTERRELWTKFRRFSVCGMISQRVLNSCLQGLWIHNMYLFNLFWFVVIQDEVSMGWYLSPKQDPSSVGENATGCKQLLPCAIAMVYGEHVMATINVSLCPISCFAWPYWVCSKDEAMRRNEWNKRLF